MPQASPTTAFVRRPSPRLVEAELTFVQRQPLDLERARAQHAEYRGLLTRLGVEVVAFPDARTNPTACSSRTWSWSSATPQS